MLSAVVCGASSAVHFPVRCVAHRAAAYLSEPFPVYCSSPSTNKVRSRQDNFLCQPSALPSSSNAGTHIHVSMFLITPTPLFKALALCVLYKYNKKVYPEREVNKIMIFSSFPFRNILSNTRIWKPTITAVYLLPSLQGNMRSDL